MKKTTKILSIFMAILMVFTCIPLTAMAEERDTSSLAAYLKNDNLAAVAATLLTDLGDRKEEVVPTVLSLVFQFVPDLKEAAAAKELNAFTATPDQLATILLDYADAALKKADLNSQISDYSSLISMLGIKNIDLNSINGVLKALSEAMVFLHKGSSKTYGDAYNLTVSDLESKTGTALKRTDGDLKIIYGVFGFLSNKANVNVIKKAIKGNFSLGTLNGTLKSFTKTDIEATVNDLMQNLDKTIDSALYAAMLQEKDGDGNKIDFEKSSYKDFSSDEILAAALIKLITKADTVSQADAKAAAAMTLYELIGTYADTAIANYAVEPLNTTVKDALKKFLDSDPQLAVLKTIINTDYTFTKDSFNFTAAAKTGLFENLNDMVCNVIKTITTADAYKELNLKTGGNQYITANLSSFFGYVLKTLSTNNGGKLEFTIDSKKYSYDFSGFTADKLATMKLEDMVVAVLELFFPGWFGEEVPTEINSLETLGAYAAYTAISKWMPDFQFNASYKALVYGSDGKIYTNKTQSYWFEALTTMGMDVACYWLNRANVNFNMTEAQAKAFKDNGWKSVDFFDEIVDWAINYISGIPAVADVLSTELGKTDGYGPWYKLNVILNDLIPMGFVNGCNDETFTLDTYKLIIEKAAPSIFDCDFQAFADILSKNTNENNPFNKSVLSATVGFIDNLLFSLLEHDCGETASFKKAATATKDGYEGTYCVANGHYMDDIKTTPATGVKDEPTTEKPSETKPTETQPSDTKPTETQPDPGEFIVGDVTGDGKVNAADARLALRCGAKLETLEGNAFKAADVDGSGTITAADARRILRFSAKLTTEV